MSVLYIKMAETKNTQNHNYLNNIQDVLLNRNFLDYFQFCLQSYEKQFIEKLLKFIQTDQNNIIGFQKLQEQDQQYNIILRI